MDRLQDQIKAHCHGCGHLDRVSDLIPDKRTPFCYWCLRCDKLLREYRAGRPIGHLQHGKIDNMDPSLREET